MTKFRLFLMTFLLSLNVWSSFRETGGGSWIDERIRARHSEFHDFLTNSTDLSIDQILHNRKSVSYWSSSRMRASLLSNELVVKNNLVIKTIFEFENIPGTFQNFMDKTFYYAAFGQSRVMYVEIRRFLTEYEMEGFDRVMFHEYLRMVGVDDNNYVVSKLLHPKFEKYVKYKNSLLNGDSIVEKSIAPAIAPFGNPERN